MDEKYVRITDLHELADAARRHLLNPTGSHPGFVPASPGLRVGAGLLDALFATIFAFCFGIVAFITTMAVANTDFDGHPKTSAMGDWFAVTYLLLGTALYSSPEAFGCRTFGKMMFGLLLVSVDENAPKRGYLRRWLFKTSPLLVPVLVALAGLVHTETLDWEVFYYFGWSVGWELLVALALPAAVVAFAFLKCLGTTRQTTYDDVGQVLVVQLSHAATRAGRGFAVVVDRPAGSAAPKPALQRPRPADTLRPPLMSDPTKPCAAAAAVGNPERPDGRYNADGMVTAMKLTLTAEDEQFVADQVKAGRFSSAADAIAEAIDRLRWGDEAIPTADDLAAARAGLDQLDRGEGVPWEDVRRKLNAKHGLDE